ncbi:hypothetical protein B0T17DRAFT_536460 [Bombardia bombarda]|uniref:Uncharacterized protein n=1 Tax=Bombardia bombarda TaxID=252184 RepID=A0AA39WM77_9PEZI|nr:hypothetical protein B0T17DRAFT_536460 [Bombardia bombarda]
MGTGNKAHVRCSGYWDEKTRRMVEGRIANIPSHFLLMWVRFNGQGGGVLYGVLSTTHSFFFFF